MRFEFCEKMADVSHVHVDRGIFIFIPKSRYPCDSYSCAILYFVCIVPMEVLVENRLFEIEIVRQTSNCHWSKYRRVTLEEVVIFELGYPLVACPPIYVFCDDE